MFADWIRTDPEVRKSAEKPLNKYRPSVLVQKIDQAPNGNTNPNGIPVGQEGAA